MLGRSPKRAMPPEPPLSVAHQQQGPNVDAAVRAAKRRGGLRGLPWFFTKQLIAISLVVVFILVVDFFLFAYIAFQEESLEMMQPQELVSIVSNNLIYDDTTGQWTLNSKAEEQLVSNDAWAMLLQDDHAVWSDRVPPDVPQTFSANKLAMTVHYATLEGYPVFFWDMDDAGLLMVGYPKNAFWEFSLHLSTDAAERLPLYALLFLSVDAAILFVYILISRQRTRRATVPLAEALADLAEGKPTSLSLGGDLAEVGRTVNEASAVIRAKDEARERWIIGVSHDIRTPLSMIIGYADSLTHEEGLSEEGRKSAELIRAQSLRIADLVQDLNTATRLEYDTQPIDVCDVALASVLRSMTATYINDRLPAGYELELDISDAAQDARFRGDERLFVRAIQNLVQNAVTHNPSGCAITIKLDVIGKWTRLVVMDNGEGMEMQDFLKLQQKLAQSGVIDGASAHGLGLVLVKRIATVHGGSFQVASSDGVGFTATMELPLSNTRMY